MVETSPTGSLADLDQETQEASPAHFSKEELAKIQLIHSSKLSKLIYSMVSVDGGRVNLPTELVQ
jgi:hypothetical protein